MLKKIFFIFLVFSSLYGCSKNISQQTHSENNIHNSVGVEKIGKIIPSGEEIFEENTFPAPLFSNGFFIDKNHIITTAHSVGNFQDLYKIHTNSGEVFTAKLIKKDRKNDNAQLQILEDFKDFQAISFQKKIQTGDEVFSIIYDIKTKKTQKKSGKIIQISDNKIFTNLQLKKGDSGSPLYTKEGNIIGINIEFDVQNQLGISMKIDSF